MLYILVYIKVNTLFGFNFFGFDNSPMTREKVGTQFYRNEI